MTDSQSSTTDPVGKQKRKRDEQEKDNNKEEATDVKAAAADAETVVQPPPPRAEYYLVVQSRGEPWASPNIKGQGKKDSHVLFRADPKKLPSIQWNLCDRDCTIELMKVGQGSGAPAPTLVSTFTFNIPAKFTSGGIKSVGGVSKDKKLFSQCVIGLQETAEQKITLAAMSIKFKIARSAAGSTANKKKKQEQKRE